MVVGLVDEMAEQRVGVWVVYSAEKWVVYLVDEMVESMVALKAERMV